VESIQNLKSQILKPPHLSVGSPLKSQISNLKSTDSSFAFFASSRFNHTNFSDPKTVIKQQTDRATVRRIAGKARSLLFSLEKLSDDRPVPTKSRTKHAPPSSVCLKIHKSSTHPTRHFGSSPQLHPA